MCLTMQKHGVGVLLECQVTREAKMVIAPARRPAG